MGYRMVKAGAPFKDARSVTVAGTTNGLVLLVLSSADMILYNPLTRVFKKVPPPLYIYENLAFGFGHGATQDDLKIVKLGVYHCDMSLSWGVFSVKNRTWSPMSESIGHYEFSDYGSTFLNGFLYWRVLKDHSSALILALDIKEMTLLEIKVPAYTMFDDTTMGTINGYLCLICPKGGSYDEYQLLVMKDHGIWEPRLKGCSASTLSRMNCDAFRAMCILNVGKLLLRIVTRTHF
uniref:F-box/kelch-repeat protein At3g06240-like n=1 Tax=Erigeron canadensis TaxID=72917 RepID=UPI001CB8BDAE|nr:F-box/kelch-repeat protein At3g06240-like [Erigeron canadensis]